ncbi:MAG: hypothetical protein WCA78_13960 [Rhizomicrobium sp.]
MADASHYLHSSLREKIVEHVFLGELLRYLWLGGTRDVSVLRPEVDDCGYDFVLGCGGSWRHVQLKASHRTAKTAYVPVNMGLSRAPSGCVVWLLFDPETLSLGPYLWLGGRPGVPLTEADLGERIGRHTRADSHGAKRKRPSIRMVGRGRFTQFGSISDVADVLFESTCQESKSLSTKC